MGTTSSISEDGAIPLKSTSQLKTPSLTPDDATDAPLDSGSSDEDDEDYDYDFTQDDSWDEGSDDDNGSDSEGSDSEGSDYNDSSTK